ncbi:hypothetical protein IWQ60_004481 [Tieghemiomyces parasiticus]|uniref:histone acetyltransferase n=1 Tax=Tieghemiomyces parasiticus TaxID=78921 RepID=A0A9W8A8A8_9FUNG|nr:hypothetical protein IWQ60_004481 [Tieghemiomyces parasiticus]
MAETSFSSYLQDRLGAYTDFDTPLVVHAIASKPHACSALYDIPADPDSTATSGGGGGGYRVTKRLLLVSQSQGSVTPSALRGPVMVAGLMAYEYRPPAKVAGVADQRPVLVYIEKVDSSGLWRRPSDRASTASGSGDQSRSAALRSPLAALLRVYVELCLAEYGRRRSVEFHVCARPQPEYLFAKSKANPAKRILNDQQLVRWWHRVLTTVAEKTAGAEVSRLSANWLVPGLSAAEARLLLGSSSQVPNSGTSATSTDAATPGLAWTYGPSHSLTTRATEVIPRFPDDPKTRLLEKPGSRAWTVAEFYEWLAIGEECGAGHRVGFYILRYPRGVIATSTVPCTSASMGDAAERESGHWCTVSKAGWETVLSLLFHTSMDFSNDQGAQRSSARFFQWMQRKFNLAGVSVRTPSAGSTSAPPDSPKVDDKDARSVDLGEPAAKRVRLAGV